MSKFVILHKRKTPYIRLCCIVKVIKLTFTVFMKKVPTASTIHHSSFIYNQFKKLNLSLCFPATALKMP